jgi:predicted permease
MAAARRELASIASQSVPEFPRVPWAAMDNGLLVRGLQDDITAAARPALLAIVAAAVVLLVIACVNVANLLLARSARRRAEFALRSALGAGGSRLVRQLLTESVMLAVTGGVLGFVVARIGVGALVALSPPGLPRVETIRVDAAAFGFGVILTTLVGVAVGLIPALSVSHADVRAGMHGASRTVAGGRGVARGALVVSEVALALVLLVGAGLLLRSLDQLFAVSPGIQPAHVLTMQVVDAGSRNRTDEERLAFYEQAVQAVRNVPGVAGAALTSQLPLSGDLDAYGYTFAAFPEKRPGEDGAAMRYGVTPDYFHVMGIRLLRGRLLDATDRRDAPESFVISQSLAHSAFGNTDPIGQHVRFGPESDGTRPWGTIVGVVGDVKQQSLASQNTAAFYVTSAQWRWVDPVQSLVVRTSGDAVALTNAVRRAVWEVDRNKPITRIATMEQLISRTASQQRFASVIYATFAIAALLLSAIGLYGVISGRVAERTREIGIRSALGATRGTIVRSVLANGLGLTAAGVAIGVAGASATSRLLEALLYGISRADLATYVGVVALLGVVAALACWVPARRAAAVDPVITLRGD